jgi:ribonuclease E
MLAAAGLSMAVTDPAKVRAAQEAAAAAATSQRIRVPRERKPLPPVSSEPLVQVETKVNG